MPLSSPEGLLPWRMLGLLDGLKPIGMNVPGLSSNLLEVVYFFKVRS